MQQLTTEPALPLDTDAMPWIPTGPGKSFRPLRFTADGWSELMRLEPGSVVALHRHTGELHAFNVSGTREILGTGELVGPGNYVYESAGTFDTWGATSDGPCVIHLKATGEGRRGYRVPRTRRPGHRDRERGQPARYLPGVVPARRRRSRPADRRVNIRKLTQTRRQPR